MAQPPSKADSFSAYLEAMKRTKSATHAATSGTPLSLMSLLEKADNKTMPLTELMAASGMPFPDFADAMKSLHQSGYVTLSGPPAETVALTPQGEQVCGLLRTR